MRLRKMPIGIYLDPTWVVALHYTGVTGSYITVRFRDGSGTDYLRNESTLDEWVEALEMESLGNRL
jgi:hypothetical protein